jgi:uncharacterized damage-inducible protein DinB
MRLVDPILMELAQEAPATRRVLERVPADRLDWRPHPKSMSLGQLALHVATIPGAIAELVREDTFELGAFTQPAATTTQELLDALDNSMRNATELVGGIDDARALALWRATKEGKEMLAIPRIGVLRAIMLNHWYHHRGQLCVYLRFLDVPLPSVYGPSADENPFA